MMDLYFFLLGPAVMLAVTFAGTIWGVRYFGRVQAAIDVELQAERPTAKTELPLVTSYTKRRFRSRVLSLPAYTNRGWRQNRRHHLSGE